MPPRLAAHIRDEVRERANFLCEYCHTIEHWHLIQFTIDHVVPVSEGGTDDLENLAFACFHCNRKKSNKQFVSDPLSGEIVQLFNPRTMSWNENFDWSANQLVVEPRSDCGRVTIDLLHLNRDRILQIRLADKLVNRHPPASDRTANSPS